MKPRVPLLVALLLACAGAGPAAASSPPTTLEAVETLLEEGRFTQALEAARALAGTAAAAGDARAEATALLRESDALYYLGRREETLAPMERALALYREIDDLEGIGRAYYSIAYYYERTDPARMIALLAQGRTYAERAGDARLRMNIANATGVALWNQGRYDEALVALGESADLAAGLGNDGAEAAAKQNIGLIHLHRGDNPGALEAFNAALALVDDRQSHATGVILGNQGNAYLGLRDLEAALSCYRRSLDIHRNNGYRRGVATQLNNVASIEEQLGHWDRAGELRRQVVATGREIGDARTTIGALTALGQLAMVRRRTAAADSLFREALAAAEAFGDPFLVARPQLELARLAFARGDTAGFAWLDRAEASAAAVPDAAELGSIRAVRAQQWARSGRLVAAIAEMRAAVTLHEQAAVRTDAHLWHAELARWQAASGDSAAAADEFRRAEAAIDGLDARIALGDFRVELFREVAAVYFDHALFLARGGRPAEAWRVLDSGRARELTLRLQEGRNRTEFTLPELEALGRLSAVQRQLREDRPDSAARRRLGREILEAEDAYAQAQLAARGRPERRAASSLFLPADALTVAFAARGDTILVFHARDGVVGWRALPGAAAILERARRWRDLVTDPSSGDAWIGTGRPLRADLLGPELVGDTPDRLVLVPDAGLWALPFAALPGPDGTPLGAETDLAVTPSLASLAALEARPHGPEHGILALANSRFAGAAAVPAGDDVPVALRDLDETAAEVAGVAALDPARTTVLRDEDEGAFKQLPLARYQLVHFATHAVADPEHPNRSCIVLAADGGDDGFLQAREVARLDLDARLVTMAGCGSGADRAVAGEGLLGLTHALLAAGTHSAVVSGWDLTDQGAAFMMRAFYANLPGRTVAAALRRAQAEARASTAWRHPAYWAAFLVAGDGDQRLELPRTSRRRRLAAPAGGLVVLVLALVAWHRRKNRAAV